MKQIKVGMIGFGNIGKLHCAADLLIPLSFGNLTFSVRLGKIMRVHTNDICPYYAEGYAADIKELLSDRDTDVVDICSPNYLHYKHAMAAITAGKHIYLEKPIGVDTAQACQIRDAASSAGVLNQSAMIYRFMPGVIAMRDCIARGDIGQVIDFKLSTLHAGYLDPSRPRSWKLRRDMSGGGPLLDVGVHLADTVRLMFGEIDQVTASMRTVIAKRPDEITKALSTVDVEDWGLAQLVLLNGLRGTIEVSRVASALDQKSTIDVYGTDGSMHFDASMPQRLRVFIRKKGVQNESNVVPVSSFAVFLSSIFPPAKFSMGWMTDVHTASLMNFYYNIMAGKVLFSETPTFSEAAKSQAVIDACYQSAAKGGMAVKV